MRSNQLRMRRKLSKDGAGWSLMAFLLPTLIGNYIDYQVIIVVLSKINSWSCARWSCAGFMQVLCWSSVDLVMVLCWSCVGLVLVLCWSCVGLVLVLCWSYAGLILTLYWCAIFSRFFRQLNPEVMHLLRAGRIRRLPL